MALYLLVIRPVEDLFETASPDDERVEIMQENPDAIILMPFVTGDVPRLLRGNELESRADELWFIDSTDAGDIIGASLFTLMGLPPITDIGISFRDGKPLSNYSCITVGCMHWPKQDSGMWGMSGLAGLGEEIGPEVRKHRRTFTDHDAYSAAHRAALQDSEMWLTSTTHLDPAPADDGMRKVIVSLPTLYRELSKDSVASPTDYPPYSNPDIAEELNGIAASLTDGTEATIDAVHGADAKPIWARLNGTYISGENGGNRALPDLASYHPVIRLTVPVAETAIVQDRAENLVLPPTRAELVAPALRLAFESWKLDTACLPDCGSAVPAGAASENLDVSIAGDPFWILEVWDIGMP